MRTSRAIIKKTAFSTKFFYMIFNIAV